MLRRVPSVRVSRLRITHPTSVEADTAMSDLFVSIANAVGLPIATFGAPDHCRGPLPGLLS